MPRLVLSRGKSLRPVMNLAVVVPRPFRMREQVRSHGASFHTICVTTVQSFPPDKCSQCKRERSRTDPSRARTLSASFGLLDGPDLGGERVDVVLGAGPPPASHVPRVHVGPTVEGGRVEAVTPSVVVRPQLPPTPPSTMASAAGGCDGGGVALLAAPLVADQLKCRV